MVGPPMVGAAMDILDPHGLAVMLGLFCGAYATIAAGHLLRRRGRADAEGGGRDLP